MGDNNKKTIAKRIGVKSVFYYKENGTDKAVVTRFGKGNSYIEAENITYNQEKNNVHNIDPGNAPFEDFEDSSKKNTFKVADRKRKIQNPKKNKLKSIKINTDLPDQFRNANDKNRDFYTDQIGLKIPLEHEIFFECPDNGFQDNIHIQLAYNIIDIKKIFAPHISNIVASVNNVGSGFAAVQSDILGSNILLNSKFNDVSSNLANQDLTLEKFVKNLGKYRFLYRDIFRFQRDFTNENETEEELNKSNNANKLRNFMILRLLSGIRNSCFHGEQKLLENVDVLFDFSSVEIIDKKFEEEEKIQTFVDNLVDKKFKYINNNFIEHSKVNIYILKKLYEAEIKNGKFNIENSIEQKYYDFVILKDQNQLGFSISLIREKILDIYDNKSFYPIRDNKKIISSRGKFNNLLDFLITNYFNTNSKQSNELITDLRFCKTEEKDQKYIEKAIKIYPVISKKLKKLIYYVKNIQNIDKDNLPTITVDMKSANDLTVLSKVVFFMCYFLDRKEINDLITTLINKFENIYYLENIIKEHKLYNEKLYNSKYSLFDDSLSQSLSLRLIKNIANLKVDINHPSYDMVLQAAYTLGAPKNNSTQELIFNQSIINSKGEETPDKSLRNILVNNVASSRRFVYIIKYTNADTISTLSKNSFLIANALYKMDDKILLRYIRAIVSIINNHNIDEQNTQYKIYDTNYLRQLENYNKEEQCAFLSYFISNTKFEQLVDFHQRKTNDQILNIQKQNHILLIGLYLLCVYQIVKNMIYINSRYVVACHNFERDSIFLNSNLQEEINNTTSYEEQKDIVEKTSSNVNLEKVINKSNNSCVLKECSYKSKQLVDSKYTKALKKYNKNIYSNYRNLICHLAINNALKIVDEYYEFSPAKTAMEQYFSEVNKEDEVSKDNFAQILKSFVHNQTIYFRIYHFVIQKKLISIKDYDKKVPEIKSSIDEEQNFSKNFLKVLNVPFGYNKARYKKLSYDYLFYGLKKIDMIVFCEYSSGLINIIKGLEKLLDLNIHVRFEYPKNIKYLLKTHNKLAFHYENNAIIEGYKKDQKHTEFIFLIDKNLNSVREEITNYIKNNNK